MNISIKRYSPKIMLNSHKSVSLDLEFYLFHQADIGSQNYQCSRRTHPSEITSVTSPQSRLYLRVIFVTKSRSCGAHNCPLKLKITHVWFLCFFACFQHPNLNSSPIRTNFSCFQFDLNLEFRPRCILADSALTLCPFWSSPH